MAWSRFGFSVAVVWTASLLVAPTSSDRNPTSGSISAIGDGNDCKPGILSGLLGDLKRNLLFRTGATEDRTEINGYFVNTISMTVNNPSEETEGEFQIKFATRKDRNKLSHFFQTKVIFNKVGHEYKEQLIDPLARDGDTPPLWPADDLSDEGWATCKDIGKGRGSSLLLEIGKGKFKLQCIRTVIWVMSCQIIEADIEAEKVVYDFGNIYD